MVNAGGLTYLVELAPRLANAAALLATIVFQTNVHRSALAVRHVAHLQRHAFADLRPRLCGRRLCFAQWSTRSAYELHTERSVERKQRLLAAPTSNEPAR